MALDGRRLKAFRLMAALGVGLTLGGCYQAAGLPMGESIAQLQARDEAARNAEVARNLRTLQMAIEQYATEYNGRYPAPGALMQALSHDYYLPGDRLPTNPWAGTGAHQGNEISTAGLQPALRPADQAPSDVGTVVGPGHGATSAAYDGLTFGALLYELDPATNAYTLYAIGKRGGEAVVVGVGTNRD